MSAGSLSSDRVKNAAGEDLGKIKGIMIGVRSGRIAYAVLSFGGVLSIGDKLFALPWEILTLDEDEKHFLLNVEKSTLKKRLDSTRTTGPIWRTPLGVLKSSTTTKFILIGKKLLKAEPCAVVAACKSAAFFRGWPSLWQPTPQDPRPVHPSVAEAQSVTSWLWSPGGGDEYLSNVAPGSRDKPGRPAPGRNPGCLQNAEYCPRHDT